MDNDARLMLDDIAKYLDKELNLWVNHEKDNVHFCLVVVKVGARLREILSMLCEAWDTELSGLIDEQIAKEAQNDTT